MPARARAAMPNRVAERDMAQRIGANQSLFAVLRIAAPAFIGYCEGGSEMEGDKAMDVAAK
jgi:hypothetical protein